MWRCWRLWCCCSPGPRCWKRRSRSDILRSMRILALFGTLSALAPASADAQNARPGADDIRTAAARCGLPERFLEIGHDAEGERAIVAPPRDGQPLAFEPFACLLR